MSQQPSEDLPEDEHLRQDVGAPGTEQESAAEFDDHTFTSGQLNAGQRVPGLSPQGEYEARQDPERDNEPGQDGFLPPEPARED
jgi:hypothetical protein